HFNLFLLGAWVVCVGVAAVTTTGSPADGVGTAAVVLASGALGEDLPTISGIQNQIATTSSPPSTAAFAGLAVSSRVRRRTRLLLATVNLSRPERLALFAGSFVIGRPQTLPNSF